MRPFRLIVLICISFFGLHGQGQGYQIELVVGEKGPFDSEDRILVGSFGALDRKMQEIVLDFHRQGFLTCYLDLRSIGRSDSQPHVLRSIWRITDHTLTTIDTVIPVGEMSVDRSVYHKMFRPLYGEPVSGEAFQKLKKVLKAYPFVHTRGDPSFAAYGDTQVALVLPIRESVQNSFMGTVGYLPEAGRSAQVTGDIQIHLENTFGTGSMADLWWQRKDEQSQILSLSHEEPFIWRFNFGGRFNFYQNLQDGLYVHRKAGLAVVVPYSVIGKWYLGGAKTAVTATPSGDSLGISDHSVRYLTIENRWERRNTVWNPYKGFFLMWKFEAGDFESAMTKNAILYRFESRWEILKEISQRWTFSAAGFGGYTFLARGPDVPESEKFRYGGAATLRGYHEQFFASDWVMIHQLEFRLSLKERNRLYGFVDIAFQDAVATIPLALGIGIVQRTPLGILQLDYAVGRDDHLANGKIHLRVTGEF